MSPIPLPASLEHFSSDLLEPLSWVCLEVDLSTYWELVALALGEIATLLLSLKPGSSRTDYILIFENSLQVLPLPLKSILSFTTFLYHFLDF